MLDDDNPYRNPADDDERTDNMTEMVFKMSQGGPLNLRQSARSRSNNADPRLTRKDSGFMNESNQSMLDALDKPHITDAYIKH